MINKDYLRLKEWRKKNPERFKQHLKKYREKPSVKEKKRIYQASYYKKWYARNHRKRAGDYIEAIIEWQTRYPEKVRAHKKVQNEILMGRMIKPKKCSDCGKETRLSAHHIDYTKPLEVKWLCSSCHKIIHLS